MLLYKYRSLKNFEFVADIILNERLHCSTYDRLNDPFEGLFLTIWKILINKKPLDRTFNICKNVEDLPVDLTKTRICSLSSSISDVRLWSNYADGHKGIVFELNFKGLDSHIHKVVYSTNLPEFTSPMPHEVLLYKTSHWEYEAEYRIIHEDKYFPISNRIEAIYLGYRISNTHCDLLSKMTSNEIAIYRTRLNTKKIQVEPDKQWNKNSS